MTENLQAVRQVLELWNTAAMHDDATLRRFAHPDVKLDLSDRQLNPATYSGFEGVRQLVREVRELWTEFRMEPEQAFEAGERIVVFVRAVGRGRGSGLEIDGRPAMVFRLREGKVAELSVIADRAQALESAGLSPDSARAAL